MHSFSWGKSWGASSEKASASGRWERYRARQHPLLLMRPPSQRANAPHAYPLSLRALSPALVGLESSRQRVCIAVVGCWVLWEEGGGVEALVKRTFKTARDAPTRAPHVTCASLPPLPICSSSTLLASLPSSMSSRCAPTSGATPVQPSHHRGDQLGHAGAAPVWRVRSLRQGPSWISRPSCICTCNTTTVSRREQEKAHTDEVIDPSLGSASDA